eukprot:2894457-Amphidinium_carterae.1
MDSTKQLSLLTTCANPSPAQFAWLTWSSARSGGSKAPPLPVAIKPQKRSLCHEDVEIKRTRCARQPTWGATANFSE